MFLSVRSSVDCPGCFRISLPVFKVDYFFQKVSLNRILYDCILHPAHEHAQSPVITYIIVSDYGNLCVYMMKSLVSQCSDFLFELIFFWYLVWLFYFNCYEVCPSLCVRDQVSYPPKLYIYIYIYRVSEEERTRLRESVP
jgi:hypothetical protein